MKSRHGIAVDTVTDKLV